ncbi:MAG: molecular chaperone SurA, partial [Betaproteobacteria bacterium]|nr:molecular chaperone SurA [Betaproteobacteria bacterium]
MTLIQIYRSLAGKCLGTSTLLSLALLVLTSPSSADTKATSPRQPVLIDAIAVVVNTDVITLKEIEERLRLLEQRLKRQNIQLPPREVLQKQLLERMIVNRAQMQLARETGIR